MRPCCNRQGVTRALGTNSITQRLMLIEQASASASDNSGAHVIMTQGAPAPPKASAPPTAPTRRQLRPRPRLRVQMPLWLRALQHHPRLQLLLWLLPRLRLWRDRFPGQTPRLSSHRWRGRGTLPPSLRTYLFEDSIVTQSLASHRDGGIHPWHIKAFSTS